MAKKDDDFLDDLDDQDSAEEETEIQSSGTRGDRRIGALSSRVGGIESQLAEIKGLLQGNRKTVVEDEPEPQFQDETEKFAWTVTQKITKLEKALADSQASQQREKQEAVFKKTLKSAVRGLDFGKHADVAQISVDSYAKAHADDPEAVRKYAETLAHRLTGKLQGTSAAEYAAKKKAAADATVRPGRKVDAAPNIRDDERNKPRDRSGHKTTGLEDARAAMLQRMGETE